MSHRPPIGPLPRPTRVRGASIWFVAIAAGLAAGSAMTNGAACVAKNSSDGYSGGYGGSSTGNTGAGGDASVDVSPDGEPPPRKYDYSALCGMGCKPGDLGACSSSGGSGGSSSTGGSSGTSGSSTASGSSSSESSSGAGGASSSSTGSASTSTGAGGAPTIPEGCIVTNDGTTPTSICAPIGQSQLNGPCQTAADCAEGFGCVASSSTGGPSSGICRPYCCGDFEDCPSSTYCAKQAMANQRDAEIPVCAAIVPCELFGGSCPDDQTCTVVRVDGTTSCVEKGTGELCEPCPCAEGFVCSAKGICQKLCHTTPSNECGSDSTCQGGSMNYPPGIGICVGGSSDCAPL